MAKLEMARKRMSEVKVMADCAASLVPTGMTEMVTEDMAVAVAMMMILMLAVKLAMPEPTLISIVEAGRRVRNDLLKATGMAVTLPDDAHIAEMRRKEDMILALQGEVDAAKAEAAVAKEKVAAMARAAAAVMKMAE